ncbi:MAG: uracil-DNA glycosylase [Cohaesibacter sp.]|jgi:uracil-DNA glycosylase|nr:uracil-DNA glycosylase [Cohaesibacter sp.]
MTLMEELEQCEDWYEALADQHAFLITMQSWLDEEAGNADILPTSGKRLNALRLTPLDEVKVVLTGQDPYPGLEGDIPHAMGLSFSVARGIKPPRSLTNIYKELALDIGMAHPGHGDLSGWAAQGVLMLNSVLTLRQGEAASHAKKGWEGFTSAVLSLVVERSQPTCFLSWGRHSHALINGLVAKSAKAQRHCVIRTSHPSPLGARKAGAGFQAFLGSRCFSRANDFLRETGCREIDWACLGDGNS